MRLHAPKIGVLSQRITSMPVFALLLMNVLGLSFLFAAQETSLNPEDPDYLRRQHAWFQAQEPSRQKQIVKLHLDFQDLDPDTQARFENVMKQYNTWLSRLPETDRQRVVAASSALARLEVVRQLREQDWVRTLPAPYRAEYAKLEDDARKQRLLEWRAEEAERNEEWSLALRTWDQFVPGKVPQLFMNEGRAQIEEYVRHLKENLLEYERKALDDSKANADDFGNYFGYALELVRLSDAHPILPGKVYAKDFNSLPEPVREYLIKNSDRHFRKKGAIAKGEELKELRRAEGRWPEFSLELIKYAQKNKLTLPVPLGDCRKEQMPPKIIVFLDEKLEPLLRRSEPGRADLALLVGAQGNWPDYPRTILDLAKKYKLSVPDWTLPGQPQAWERIRLNRARAK